MGSQNAIQILFEDENPENLNTTATFYNTEDTFFVGGKQGGFVETQPSHWETPASVLDTTFTKIHIQGK